MLRKQGFKLQLMIASVLLLAMGGVYADSTSIPSLTSIPEGQTAAAGTAAVSGNQMFLLTSGDVDFTSNSTNNGYVCQPSNTTGGCAGAVNSNQRIHSSQLCPTGFVPYIVTTMAKTLDVHISTNSTANNLNAICPTVFWAHENGQGSTYSGYEFGFSATAASNSGSLSGTAVAFHWDIYCYPGSYTNPATPGPNNWTTPYTNTNGGTCSDATPWFCEGNNTATCSTNNFAPTYSYDKSPLLWDEGYISGGQGNTWYNTNRLCPNSYTPYLALSLVETQADFNYNSSSSNTPGKSFACVYSTWGSPNSSQLGWPYLNTNATNYNFNTGFGEMSNWKSNEMVRWTLYCYPSGVSIPAYTPCETTPGASTPFILDSGTVSMGSLASAKTTTSTGYFLWPPGQCPSGWTPYSNVWPQDTHNGAPQNGITLLPINPSCNATSGVPRTVVRFYDYTVEGGTTYWGGVDNVGYVIWCFPPGQTPGFTSISPTQVNGSISQWINASNGIISSLPCT